MAETPANFQQRLTDEPPEGTPAACTSSAFTVKAPPKLSARLGITRAPLLRYQYIALHCRPPQTHQYQAVCMYRQNARITARKGVIITGRSDRASGRSRNGSWAKNVLEAPEHVTRTSAYRSLGQGSRAPNSGRPDGRLAMLYLPLFTSRALGFWHRW